MPATNAGQYGFAVDSDTSPANLALVQSHIGKLAASGDPRGWHDGELGSVRRAASVFSEYVGMKNQKVGEDGTSWYHPSRLSIDSGAINNGVDNPAQAVYGDHATMGHSVKLPMYSVRHLAWWRTCRGCDPPARRAVQGAEGLGQDRQADQDVLAYRSAQRRTLEERTSSRRSFPS